MKPNVIWLTIIICLVLVSCVSLGINLGVIFSPSKSKTSGSSQNEPPNSSSQQTQNNSNRGIGSDAENWDIAALDTAANANYLTDLEKDIILEMNKARTNPKKYAELYVQPLLKYFSGKNYSVPGRITIVTQEGSAAVNDCIAALSRASNAGVLRPEKGLSLAAKDHVADQGGTGQVGHNGSDKSNPEARMRRYGTFRGSWILGENIAYGNIAAREIVCSLLIDDGTPDRGHRANIMNRTYSQTGVAYGIHPQYKTICTITYANNYKSN
ncbi:MAG: CAP domain-containing protein [Treponema sp.]|nr:CAP domain-containing protein [Treponema sp.]